MTPEIQLDLFSLFTPASGGGKPPPPAPVASQPPASPAAPALVFVRSRRARNYRITLKRDGTAVVTIPARGSEREARRFADQHAGWLARARARQEKHPRVAATWTIGARVLWRGEMTTIQIAPGSPAARPAVVLAREDASPPPDTRGAQSPASPGGGDAAAPVFRVASLTANLRPALEAHFQRIAKIELPARAWELAAETRVPVTEVGVRNQRTRWGSCTTAGVISLNWRLVQAPLFVRDYIIYHELMHLREMNHSPRFWARVAEVCPWWRDAERWIKQNGGPLGL